MARNIKTNVTANITLTLDKTEVGKYPQAKVYSSTDVLLATSNLSEVDSVSFAGVYKGTFTTPATEQDVYMIYKIYTDSGHTTEDTSQDYNATDELYVQATSAGSSGSGAYSHTDTIVGEDTFPVEGANIYIYSDSARLALIASTTTLSNGVYDSTLYADAAGTYYRRIVASGRPVTEDTVTFS